MPPPAFGKGIEGIPSVHTSLRDVVSIYGVDWWIFTEVLSLVCREQRWVGLTGVGKLGRSKVGLSKLGLGKFGFGKVGRRGGKLGRGTTSERAW